MTSLLWCDIESTGLNPVINDVIQIACVPQINGVIDGEFNQFCQPLNYEAVDQGAVDVHGITVEKMRTFQSQAKALDKFISYLKSFNTRFTLAGYNVDFDRKFIGAMFQKHGKNKEYRELFSNNIHDTIVRAKLLKKKKLITSAALGSVAQYLGIDLVNAHDAIHDIHATIKIDQKLSELIGEESVDQVDSLQLPDFEVPEVPALHIHSEFSVYDSATTAESWLKWANDNSVTAVAFPDHTFSSSLYYATNGIRDKQGKIQYPNVHMVPAVSLWVRSDTGVYQLSAWASTDEGYRNIVKLSSIGWTRPIDLDDKKQAGCVDIETIRLHRAGVVFGTACENGLVSYLLDKHDNSESLLEELGGIKSNVDDIVLELLPIDINKTFNREYGLTACKRPVLSPYQNRAKAINSYAWNVLRPQGYRSIVSSIAHFIEPDDKIIQDCKMKNAFKDNRHYWESRHQRSAKEQFAILSTHIEGFSLDNWLECKSVSEAIAEASKVISIKHDYHLPTVEIPEDIKLKTDDYNKQLYYLTMAKIKEHGRWNDSKLYVDRFKKELDVIWKNKTMNFLPYFLVYEDIGSFARSRGILQGLARGSAGGCLLSYYLKVTHIDPVANNLPFERFLSHARIGAGSFPDIDSDFGSRGPILQYLREKYRLGFAQIGTFQKMKVKSAIKHAMFALYGRAENDAETKSICDLIPDSPQGLDEQKFIYGYIDSEEVVHKGVVETVPELRMFFDQYPDCEMLVKKLIGLPAHLGRHPSAFVISTLDLSDGRVPTFITEDEDVGMVQTVQFDGPMCERSGLVKADILGVTTIQTISDCIGKIKDRHGVDLLTEDEMGVAEVYRLPEDPAVFKDFYNRKTDSSFQFNTDLIKSMIRDFAPQSIKDLSDITALARPGALDVEAAPGISATKMYILVKSGQREPEYIHPDLESILKETHSTVAFQEQLMSILVEFCDYSLEESDQIRSAIAKKKREVMTKAFERVREATAKRGWTPEQSQSLCDVLSAYSNYSFNRSHSCLAPWQQIMTPSGPVEIKDLSVGDQVLSSNIDGTISVCDVAEKVVVGHKELYEVELEDGSIMHITDDHMMATTVGWRSVREIYEQGLEMFCHESSTASAEEK